MVLDDPFLGPAPESIQSIGVDLAGGEILAVINFQVPISTEHKAVVAFKLIGKTTAPLRTFCRGLPEISCKSRIL